MPAAVMGPLPVLSNFTFKSHCEEGVGIPHSTPHSTFSDENGAQRSEAVYQV